MAQIPNSMGDNDSKDGPVRENGALIDWVMERVKHGRDQRDGQYGERWKEYTRIWRGYFAQRSCW